jgi:hypothetical protein
LDNLKAKIPWQGQLSNSIQVLEYEARGLVREDHIKSGQNITITVKKIILNGLLHQLQEMFPYYLPKRYENMKNQFLLHI